MEDVLLNWPLEAPILEPLQPLSLSVLNESESSISLDRLSRSEIAGKLLEHLDQIAEGQETEPFDWFSNEKTIDIPIFENIPSPDENVIQSNIKPVSAPHYTYFDSPEYEPTFTPTNYAFGTPVAEAIQPQQTYVPSFNAGITMTNPPTETALPSATPIAEESILKKEVLTPPDSPKDEEILKLLEEIEPGDWEKLVFGERTDVDVTPSSTVSEKSYSPVDDFSDYAASSPYVGSESSSDDVDYVPRSARKMSSSKSGSTKRRNSKPYSRHSVEERKLRKKEQNKNAATRYRMKKKQEVEEFKNEENRLADKNKILRNKVDDISREIKCLKSLMRDIYQKKGLIN